MEEVDIRVSCSHHSSHIHDTNVSDMVHNNDVHNKGIAPYGSTALHVDGVVGLERHVSVSQHISLENVRESLSPTP